MPPLQQVRNALQYQTYKHQFVNTLRCALFFPAEGIPELSILFLVVLSSQLAAGGVDVAAQGPADGGGDAAIL